VPARRMLPYGRSMESAKGEGIDGALDTLYGAPFADFTKERTRLSGELKRAGAKADAKVLSTAPKPTLASWAVNRMWRAHRGDFEALFSAGRAAREAMGTMGRNAEKFRAATDAQRGALAVLRERAAAVLRAEGQAATEATLRRVATTLSALAAAGSFAPDVPGRLVADRDPPGFETMVELASVLGANEAKHAEFFRLQGDGAAPLFDAQKKGPANDAAYPENRGPAKKQKGASAWAPSEGPRAEQAVPRGGREKGPARAEPARPAEDAARAEQMRRAEKARRAEEGRRAEEARRAEQTRRAEEARRAEKAARAEREKAIASARRALATSTEARDRAKKALAARTDEVERATRALAAAVRDKDQAASALEQATREEAAADHAVRVLVKGEREGR
jgi:hypothetical protein